MRLLTHCCANYRTVSVNTVQMSTIYQIEPKVVSIFTVIISIDAGGMHLQKRLCVSIQPPYLPRLNRFTKPFGQQLDLPSPIETKAAHTDKRLTLFYQFYQPHRKVPHGRIRSQSARLQVSAPAVETVPHRAIRIHRDHQPLGHPQPAQGHRAFYERCAWRVRSLYAHPQQLLGRRARACRRDLWRHALL